jgi:mortality factor 4-like protein 1
MDEQSVKKLRDEITKMTSWLGKNSKRFFTAEYEAATPEYIEKARGD